MSELSVPHPSLAPFTYVKDASDFIYYVRDNITDQGTEGYSAVCVYYPDEAGDRVQAESGLKYSKFASGGLEYERSAVLENMPKQPAEYVLDHSRKGDIFNQEFLFLPSDEIVEAYNPNSSLQKYLDNFHTGLGAIAVEAVQRAVSTFESFNIPSNALGLYGSLQCGVNKVDPKAIIKDVDMLVEGINYYDNIRAIAAENPAPDVPLPLTVASDRARALAVRRRRQIAQFAIPRMEEIHCDVRLLRGKEDPDDYQGIASMEPHPTIVRNAEVVEARQSLSLPFAYQISTEKSGDMWAVGKHYRSLGVAMPGDSVEVRGLKIAEDTILISHPSEDWIQPRSTRPKPS